MYSGAQSESNDKSENIYEQLNKSFYPLYNGLMHSKLSVAVRLLIIKSDYSISEVAMDSIIGLMKEVNQKAWFYQCIHPLLIKCWLSGQLRVSYLSLIV